jgi:pimeloyl-ACP methyl ester carboxylesterase
VNKPQKKMPRAGGFTERFAKVNGVRLRYLVGGQGSPVVLLHGFAETSHMWRPIMPLLAERHTVVVPDLRGYARAYAQPGAMRSGFEYFRNFERDAEDFARLAGTRLSVPIWVLSGEKAAGTFLIEQANLVASDVRGKVVKGAGHWLIEEAPTTVIPAISDFVA